MIGKILGILLILVSIMGIVTVWYTYFEKKDLGPEIVKCYDRYGNEIIGQECIDDTDLVEHSIFITVIFVLLIGLSPIISIMDRIG